MPSRKSNATPNQPAIAGSRTEPFAIDHEVLSSGPMPPGKMRYVHSNEDLKAKALSMLGSAPKTGKILEFQAKA